VLANQNKRKAYLYGANANLFVDFTKSFSLTSTITFTQGQIVEEEGNDPLDHIPPVIGKTGVVYHYKGFRGELFANYNGWKHIEDYNAGGEDNEQYATPEGMPAWWTLNMRLQYQINKYLLVQAACENISDANYRVFASGISAPGRNVILSVRASF
jgi:hemoglobin/transferrin/lactoferrin receptor protein